MSQPTLTSGRSLQATVLTIQDFNRNDKGGPEPVSKDRVLDRLIADGSYVRGTTATTVEEVPGMGTSATFSVMFDRRKTRPSEIHGLAFSLGENLSVHIEYAKEVMG